jgi:hypothetical protein
MKTIQRVVPDDYIQEDAATHLAAVASALASMPMARAISSTQFVEPDEAATIEQLVSVLAARHGLCARIEHDDGALTVIFERDG